MRISDWSSDVCSSDLYDGGRCDGGTCDGGTCDGGTALIARKSVTVQPWCWLSPGTLRAARVVALEFAREDRPIMQFTSARGVAVAALALAAGFTALPAQAAPDQAREAVGLFAQSCLKHDADPADLRAWIKATPQ